jgi:FkbM family methyltransferase
MNAAKFLKGLIPESSLKNSLRNTYRNFAVRNKASAIAEKYGCEFEHYKSDNITRIKFLKGPLRYQEVKFQGVDLIYTIPVMYELNSYFPNRHIIPEDSIVIDAGSFPGDFAVVAARMASKGKVYALEPEPSNRQQLRSTLALNKSNVEVLPYALSNTDCTNAHLMQVSHASHCARLLREGERTSAHRVGVRAVRLDTLVNELGINGRPLFVKMDIEGHELEAYDGAPEVIDKGATFAIAAYHKVDGKVTADLLVPKFRAQGYISDLCYKLHPTVIAVKPRH